MKGLHVGFWVFLQLLVLSFAGVQGFTRTKRYVGQFGDMIRYSTNREALLYNAYGNHCGFEGNDAIPVVDEVDRCCYQHDRCYEQLRQGACSSHWLGPSWVFYDWHWDERSRSLHCTDSPDTCDLATCQCDKAAAECFTRHEWRQENKRPSGYDRFAEARFRAFQLFGTWVP